jgi:hypothetical protein
MVDLKKREASRELEKPRRPSYQQLQDYPSHDDLRKGKGPGIRKLGRLAL